MKRLGRLLADLKPEASGREALRVLQVGCAKPHVSEIPQFNHVASPVSRTLVNRSPVAVPEYPRIRCPIRKARRDARKTAEGSDRVRCRSAHGYRKTRVLPDLRISGRSAPKPARARGRA